MKVNPEGRKLTLVSLGIWLSKPADGWDKDLYLGRLGGACIRIKASVGRLGVSE